MPNDTCYACDRPATTREHAPPKSFFPRQGRGLNLITVPSCSIHNCGNSRDVEYVRNAVVFLAGVNGTGESMIEAAKRSFDHSHALFNRTFQSFLVRSQKERVGTYKCDLQRMEAVMTAVAHALHYRDQRQKWDRWRVFVPSFGSESAFFYNRPDDWEGFRALLSRIPYVDRATAEAEVFKYGSCALDWGWIYRFTFYGAFVVNAWMLREND